MRLLIGGMLALAVSVPLTPANALDKYWRCDREGVLMGRRDACLCRARCGSADLYARVRRSKPGAFCDILVIPPDIRACVGRCDQAMEAARHSRVAAKSPHPAPAAARLCAFAGWALPWLGAAGGGPVAKARGAGLNDDADPPIIL